MKIAIVKLSALGDIVHAMFILQVLKKKMTHVEIDWIVEEMFAPLLENQPHIHQIHTVNLKSLKERKINFFRELKKVKFLHQNKYDLVIDLQGLIKSAIVAKLLGKSVGFSKDAIRESFAAVFYKKTFFVPYENNVIQRNMALVYKALDMEGDVLLTETKEPLLFFKPIDIQKIDTYLSKGQHNIIYILGSSWESKVYPKEKFVEIVNKLEGNPLLLWGNEKEYDAALYVSEHSNAQCLPKLNLNELKALISKADLVIGADSGPTHFAWALNRPSITIFGPTPSERNTLVTSINKVIDCGKKIDPLRLNKKDFCIQKIEAKKIIQLAKELLL